MDHVHRHDTGHDRSIGIASPRSWADFETDIAAEGGKWASFYEQEDLEGLMTLYVDDAIVALHGQPALFGIDAIREYFSTRIGKAESVFELDYELKKHTAMWPTSSANTG